MALTPEDDTQTTAEDIFRIDELEISDWTTVFPNPRLCKALLDCVTDRAHIIETGTESFRFRRTMERRKKKP